MRDREMRRWRILVRERAKAEWRELSSEVVDELACHLADLHTSALDAGASEAEADRIATDALQSASFLELSKRPRARRSPVGYVHDVRIACRQLLATPVVTIVAVLSLALGIGANTAIFSLVDSLVLRALPVKDPARLAIITDTADRSATNYRIWQEIERRRLFDGAFAWCETRFNLAERGETDLVDGIWASSGMFDTMGVSPLLGRGFVEADDQRGGGPDGPVAVISYAFWQRRFGGAPNALGARLTLERIPFTIVGVMPPEFFGPDVGRRYDIVIPIGTEPLIRTGRVPALDEPWWWWLQMMVRLKPGQSLDAGTAALRGVQPLIRAATMPSGAPAEATASYLKDAYVLVGAATGNSDLRRTYQRPLVILMIVVALVLLIASANIANLLLARATARRHEMSVRLALGASRWRLARQLLTESLVLASTGALLGLAVARWGSRLLVQALSTRTHTVFLDLPLDWRMLGFTTAVTIATALLFGLAPAFCTSGLAPIDAMKDGGRSASDRRIGAAAALVVAQVALSVVLLVAAGLFIRTFTQLAARPLGFDRHRVLLVRVDIQRVPIEPRQRMPILEQALEAIRRLPGVNGAGVSLITPIGGDGWNGRFEVSGGVPLTDRQRRVYRNMVTPGWFATFGTPIIAGRDFATTDRTGAPLVAIVNETFARRFLNDASPLGHTAQQVGFAGGRPMEIVGVVADAAYQSVRAGPPPTIYTSALQPELGPPATSFELSVRAATGSPALLTHSVAAAIAGVHRDLALTFRTLSDQVDASLTQERIVATLSGFFGGLALLLAGLGLYGVTSYAVARRRTEIGIRMALGAPPSGVVRMVLARVSLLVGGGVLIGAAISAWAAKFVATLLFGLEPRDPATLIGSAALLGAVGALAGWLPAQRASRIDPAEVLREG